MSDTFMVMKEIIGDSLFVPLNIFFVIYSINFGYVHARGIKKMDSYFENGKNYNDTFTFAATYRFGTYCEQFLRGKLKVNDLNMRLWMYFNAFGYAFFTIVLLGYVFLSIYLELFG